MNSIEPTPPPPSLPPNLGGPAKPDHQRLHMRIAVAGLVVGIFSTLVAALNWVIPFAAVGPSPIPNPFVYPTPSVGPAPPLPTPSATPIPPAAPVIPATVPSVPPSAPQPQPKRLPRPLTPVTTTSGQSDAAAPAPALPPRLAPILTPDTDPTPTPRPVEDPDDPPQVSIGDQIVVTAEPLQDPKGPRPLSTLRYPPIPATDAVRSRLTGGVIACQVSVGEDKQVKAICNSNLQELAPFFLRRAEAVLERVEWQAAVDETGKPRQGVVTVRFRMN